MVINIKSNSKIFKLNDRFIEKISIQEIFGSSSSIVSLLNIIRKLAIIK